MESIAILVCIGVVLFLGGAIFQIYWISGQVEIINENLREIGETLKTIESNTRS